MGRALGEELDALDDLEWHVKNEKSGVRLLDPAREQRRQLSKTIHEALEPERAERALSILVVDDEPSVRRLAMRCLERRGHSVFGAAGIEEAELFAQKMPLLDVLLVDLVMQHRKDAGREIARQVLERAPKTVVVFMSGYDTLDTPGYPLVRKPFIAGDLCQAVEEAHAVKRGTSLGSAMFSRALEKKKPR